MLVAGRWHPCRWHLCDDGVTRPFLRANVVGAQGRAVALGLAPKLPVSPDGSPLKAERLSPGMRGVRRKPAD